MILVIDALNRHLYPTILDDMFRLRARVFAGRLGWEVKIRDGREVDLYDQLDPAYIIGLDDAGNVISCMRALQTTGPHMLADVFGAILRGEPPLRATSLWEATRFCVDTERVSRGAGAGSISWVTSELMIGALEYAIGAGISDIIAVIDPVMDRVLKRAGNGFYDYVGECTPMGKVSAMAGLIDCTEERLDKLRAQSGIGHDVFASEPALRGIEAAKAQLARAQIAPADATLAGYLRDQIKSAESLEDRAKAWALVHQLSETGVLTLEQELARKAS